MQNATSEDRCVTAYNDERISQKKKKLKIFFFFFKKRGGSLIRACSLIRSNTVMIIEWRVRGTVPPHEAWKTYLFYLAYPQ